jgi:hypothetical protein
MATTITITRVGDWILGGPYVDRPTNLQVCRVRKVIDENRVEVEGAPKIDVLPNTVRNVSEYEFLYVYANLSRDPGATKECLQAQHQRFLRLKTWSEPCRSHAERETRMAYCSDLIARIAFVSRNLRLDNSWQVVAHNKLAALRFAHEAADMLNLIDPMGTSTIVVHVPDEETGEFAARCFSPRSVLPVVRWIDSEDLKHVRLHCDVAIDMHFMQTTHVTCVLERFVNGVRTLARMTPGCAGATVKVITGKGIHRADGAPYGVVGEVALRCLNELSATYDGYDRHEIDNTGVMYAHLVTV